MAATMLIVEDNAVLRASLREWLEDSFVGCSWLEAASGDEAVALARARSPDLVLIDIGPPNLKGIYVTEEIRAVAPLAQIVVVATHEAPEYRADAEAAGANGYVVKGSISRDLIPTLRSLLLNGGAP